MKCKYRKVCELYDMKSELCTKKGGMYYANETEPAGCYVKMFEKEQKEDLK